RRPWRTHCRGLAGALSMLSARWVRSALVEQREDGLESLEADHPLRLDDQDELLNADGNEAAQPLGDLLVRASEVVRLALGGLAIWPQAQHHSCRQFQRRRVAALFFAGAAHLRPALSGDGWLGMPGGVPGVGVAGDQPQHPWSA